MQTLHGVEVPYYAVNHAYTDLMDVEEQGTRISLEETYRKGKGQYHSVGGTDIDSDIDSVSHLELRLAQYLRCFNIIVFFV
jgi:hypothetical protein